MNKGKRKNYKKKSSLKNLLSSSQKKPGTGPGSAIRENAGSGSALYQCGSETLTKISKIIDKC